MIKSIEKSTGVTGPTWSSWSDQEIKKLYVTLRIGGSEYFEDTGLIDN
jgi:hypothetical protein